MRPQPPIPESLWNAVSPQAQAAFLAVVDLLKKEADAFKREADASKGRIDELEAAVRDLQARLKLNSTNSSKPPSTDPVGFKRKPPVKPSGRKRGGQPGKPRALRALVSPEKLQSSTECKPTSCRRCGHDLQGEDAAPVIRQVAEIPKIEPIVKQYRLHRLTCPKCGTSTCGKVPEGVPAGCFSPYTQAVLATLAGAYRLRGYPERNPVKQDIRISHIHLRVTNYGRLDKLDSDSTDMKTVVFRGKLRDSL